MVRWLIRLDGLAVFIASLIAYTHLGYSLFIFLLLFLLPDVFMVGYLKNNLLGAKVYNVVHNYLVVLLLFGVAYYGRNYVLVEGVSVASLGLILAAHIGMDRFFGFGNKYEESFRKTHIQRL